MPRLAQQLVGHARGEQPEVVDDNVASSVDGGRECRAPQAIRVGPRDEDAPDASVRLPQRRAVLDVAALARRRDNDVGVRGAEVRPRLGERLVAANRPDRRVGARQHVARAGGDRQGGKLVDVQIQILLHDGEAPLCRRVLVVQDRVIGISEDRDVAVERVDVRELRAVRGEGLCFVRRALVRGALRERLRTVIRQRGHERHGGGDRQHRRAVACRPPRSQVGCQVTDVEGRREAPGANVLRFVGQSPFDRFVTHCGGFVRRPERAATEPGTPKRDGRMRQREAPARRGCFASVAGRTAVGGPSALPARHPRPPHEDAEGESRHAAASAARTVAILRLFGRHP